METAKASILSVGHIATHDKDKRPNGYLLTLANIHEGALPIEQVYITVCDPGDVKGPHMHEGDKHDRFYCIEGRAVVVCRNEETGQIDEFLLEALSNNYLLIPPYNSHAVVALDGKRAVVLSMPSEAYSPGKPYNQTETSYDSFDWVQCLKSY